MRFTDDGRMDAHANTVALLKIKAGQEINVCMYVLYYLHSLERIYKYRTQIGE